MFLEMGIPGDENEILNNSRRSNKTIYRIFPVQFKFFAFHGYRHVQCGFLHGCGAQRILYPAKWIRAKVYSLSLPIGIVAGILHLRE